MVATSQPGTAIHTIEGIVFKSAPASTVASCDGPRKESNLAAKHPLMHQILSGSLKSDDSSASPSPSPSVTRDSQPVEKNGSASKHSNNRDDAESADDEGSDEEIDLKAKRVKTRTHMRSEMVNGVDELVNGELKRDPTKQNSGKPHLNGDIACNGEIHEDGEEENHNPKHEEPERPKTVGNNGETSVAENNDVHATANGASSSTRENVSNRESHKGIAKASNSKISEKTRSHSRREQSKEEGQSVVSNRQTSRWRGSI